MAPAIPAVQRERLNAKHATVRLLLLVMVTVLSVVGVFSYFGEEVVHYQADEHTLFTARLSMGVIKVAHVEREWQPGWEYRRIFIRSSPSKFAGVVEDRRILGTGWVRTQGRTGKRGIHLCVSIWLIVAVMLLPVALSEAGIHRRRRRIRRGQCVVCGYDLRASPDRCPECGWTVTFIAP